MVQPAQRYGAAIRSRSCQHSGGVGGLPPLTPVSIVVTNYNAAYFLGGSNTDVELSEACSSCRTVTPHPN